MNQQESKGTRVGELILFQDEQGNITARFGYNPTVITLEEVLRLTRSKLWTVEQNDKREKETKK